MGSLTLKTVLARSCSVKSEVRSSHPSAQNPQKLPILLGVKGKAYHLHAAITLRFHLIPFSPLTVLDTDLPVSFQEAGKTSAWDLGTCSPLCLEYSFSKNLHVYSLIPPRSLLKSYLPREASPIHLFSHFTCTVHSIPSSAFFSPLALTTS